MLSVSELLPWEHVQLAAVEQNKVTRILTFVNIDPSLNRSTEWPKCKYLAPQRKCFQLV